jgi:hypothetical protein
MDGPQGVAQGVAAEPHTTVSRAPVRISALRSEDISVRIYRGGKVSEVKVP